MPQQATKTRFAPSPTGRIHLGNLRVAFFCYLVAKRDDGTFLLRLEDTDLERSRDKYIHAIMEDLEWLQMPWDEGGASIDEYSEKNCGYTPYRQSQRSEFYDEFLHQLVEKGFAYKCFCQDIELKLKRRLQLQAGIAPKYDGTCRKLEQTTLEEKLKTADSYVYRFNMQDFLEQRLLQKKSPFIEFTDKVHGREKFKIEDIGDFILKKSDGMSSFFFANAIDDALMQVSLVIRGEDHLSNTSRQIAILEALDLPIPDYAHTSLVSGDDGAPLSKRNGSSSIKELREKGYLPGAIHNYLARLGHSYEKNEFLSLAELSSDFSFTKCSKSSSRFDLSQLNFWQKQAVANCDAQTLAAWLEASKLYIPANITADSLEKFYQLMQQNIVFAREAIFWSRVFFDADFNFFDETYLCNLYQESFNEELNYEELSSIINGVDARFFEAINASLQKVQINNEDDYKTFIADLKTRLAAFGLNLKGREFFAPLRILVSGNLHGLALTDIFCLIEPKTLIKRFVAR